MCFECERWEVSLVYDHIKTNANLDTLYHLIY